MAPPPPPPLPPQEDSFADLHLEVKAGGSTLEDLLELHGAAEDLDGVECSGCGGRHR